MPGVWGIKIKLKQPSTNHLIKISKFTFHTVVNIAPMFFCVCADYQNCGNVISSVMEFVLKKMSRITHCKRKTLQFLLFTKYWTLPYIDIDIDVPVVTVCESKKIWLIAFIKSIKLCLIFHFFSWFGFSLLYFLSLSSWKKYT